MWNLLYKYIPNYEEQIKAKRMKNWNNNKNTKWKYTHVWNRYVNLKGSKFSMEPLCEGLKNKGKFNSRTKSQPWVKGF